MKDITVVSMLANGMNVEIGQVVKANEFKKELVKHVQPNKIDFIDTYNWEKRIVSVFAKCIRSLFSSNNLIFLSSHHSVEMMGKILSPLNKVLNRRIHYIVVGGQLPEEIRNDKGIIDRLRWVDYIYVETETIKRALEQMGFSNVIVMYNFKELKISDYNEINVTDRK